jgi:hypothetical protein
MALDDSDLADIAVAIHFDQARFHIERVLTGFRRGLVFNDADDAGFNLVGTFGSSDFKILWA